jgi:hypothetical protein
MVSTAAGVPAPTVVFTAVDVPVVPTVAKVSAVTAIPIAVDVLIADSVSNVSGGPYCCWLPCCFLLPCCSCLPAVVGIPAVAGVPNMVKIPSVYVVSTGSCTLRLASPDVLVVFFTALSPSVYVVLSAVHLSGVPAVASLRL